MFLLTHNKCCPGCGASQKELLPDTQLAGGSVAGTFLAGLAPELVVWLAVGAGLLAGGLLGVTVGIVLFGLLLWGAWWMERRFTFYLCLACGRKSRYTELANSA
jgi:high-affinity Fe2+/Pb2+ permease